MPTQIYHVTPTPTNLVSELSLTEGDPYMLQVTDPSPSPSVVRLHEAATAPDPSDGGHVLQNLALVGITPADRGGPVVLGRRTGPQRDRGHGGSLICPSISPFARPAAAVLAELFFRRYHAPGPSPAFAGHTPRYPSPA